MNTTIHKFTDELNEIVNLTMYRNEITDKELYLEQKDSFIAIPLDCIKDIEFNEVTITIKTPILWVKIWKNVQNFHISIFNH